MADINHEVSNRFDQTDINAILTLAKSGGLAVGDKINLILGSRRDEIKRRELQNLSLQLIQAYDAGDITITNPGGVLGTAISNWSTTAHTGGTAASDIKGLAVVDPREPDNIYLTDLLNAGDKIWKVKKADGTDSAPLVSFSDINIVSLACDPNLGVSGTLYMGNDVAKTISLKDVDSDSIIQTIAFGDFGIDVLFVDSIVVRPDGLFWLSIRDTSTDFFIVLVDRSATVHKKIPNSQNTLIGGMALLPNNDIWTFYDNTAFGVTYYDDSANAFDTSKDWNVTTFVAGVNSVHSATFDPDGTLWVGLEDTGVFNRAYNLSTGDIGMESLLANNLICLVMQEDWIFQRD